MKFNLKKGGYEIERFIEVPKTATVEELQTLDEMLENSLNDAIEEKTAEILEACFGSSDKCPADNEN